MAGQGKRRATLSTDVLRVRVRVIVGTVEHVTLYPDFAVFAARQQGVTRRVLWVYVGIDLCWDLL